MMVRRICWGTFVNVACMLADTTMQPEPARQNGGASNTDTGYPSNDRSHVKLSVGRIDGWMVADHQTQIYSANIRRIFRYALATRWTADVRRSEK